MMRAVSVKATGETMEDQPLSAGALPPKAEKDLSARSVHSWSVCPTLGGPSGRKFVRQFWLLRRPLVWTRRRLHDGVQRRSVASFPRKMVPEQPDASLTRRWSSGNPACP